MKKKLSFQKKIIANLNADQMNTVNGGAISGPKCVVYPTETRERTCALETYQCISNVGCPVGPF